MHISLGCPLISAEHEPHFPALQFQRTARSGACSAWILWTASSTTIPSPASTVYSLSSPPPPPLPSGLGLRAPRKIRKRRCSLTSRPFLDELHEIGGKLGLRLPADRHPISLWMQHDLAALLLRIRVGVIAARVTAAALRALERGAHRHLRHGQERPQVERRVPARIVLPAARDPHVPRALLEPLELCERLFKARAVTDDPRLALHHVLQRRLYRERVLPVGVLEGGERRLHEGVGHRTGNRRGGGPAAPLREFGGMQPSPSPEHEQVGEGVPSQP